MDPETTYAEMIAWAKSIQHMSDTNGWKQQDLYNAIEAAEALAEQVLDLDEWIQNGGFLPRAWGRIRRAITRRAARNISADPIATAREALQLLRDIKAEALLRHWPYEVGRAAQQAINQTIFLVDALREQLG